MWWPLYAGVFGAIGWLVGSISVFGQYGPRIGLLIGVVVGSLLWTVNWILSLHAAEPEEIEALRRRIRRRRLREQERKTRIVALVVTSIVGYLAGAAYNGSLVYPTWFAWIVGMDWFWLTALFLFSDPADEPWPDLD